MTNTRPERRCPRTWPHQPHGPWFTGEITHAAEVVGFDCPGVPVEGGAMSDRTVHANLASGGQIVRYERAGKWYLEYADGTRGRLTVREAAERAVLPDSVWFMGRPGGQAFDAKVRAALHRREDAGSGFDR